MELLEDMSDDDNDWQKTAGDRIWHPQVIPVNYETMADGEIVWLGKYTFTVGPPVQPGTYQLFLWATDGALGNVKGSISMQQKHFNCYVRTAWLYGYKI